MSKGRTMNGGEKRLVHAIHAGDQNALELLYRRNAERLWRFACLMTRSRETAADVVQETFVRALRSSDRFMGRSSAATWLFAIARNIAIDHLRRRRIQRSSDAPQAILRLIPDRQSPDSLEQDEQRQAVREAVGQLRPAQRTAVILCHLCELTIAEAANALGWSESRVKVTLHRGRLALRDKLRESWGNESGRADEARQKD